MLKNFEQNGEPVWRDSSDRVEGVMRFRDSKSKYALDKWQHDEEKRMQKKGAAPKYGVIPYAILRTKDGGPMPTKREWLEKQQNSTMDGRKEKLFSGKIVEIKPDLEKMAEFRNRRMNRPRRKNPDKLG